MMSDPTVSDQELAALRRMSIRATMKRSPRIAKLRVRIKRRLRMRGIYPSWDVTTAELIRMSLTAK